MAGAGAGHALGLVVEASPAPAALMDLPDQIFTKNVRADHYYDQTIMLMWMASIVALILLFVYHFFFSHREDREGEGLILVHSVDKCVIALLRKCSLKYLPDTRFRGLTHKNNTVALSFENLGATIKGRHNLCGADKSKQVLAGVNGAFQSGRIAAIMGPSGAGKTTLLNVLCGKAGASSNYKVTGQVEINGDTQFSLLDLKPVIGFVPQDDIVHERLTVRENIKFSARLRNPRNTSLRVIQRVTGDVLQALQLEAQQGIIVGNRAKGDGGLSGGQRKRVNIGLELAACPTLLFLDEPTSGLDSTSSLMLVEQLKQMAKLGMTIVMVVHQPRYSLFTLIDDVLLLGKGGRTVYMGPTNDAMQYFNSLGFEMPLRENPADWFMDVISGQAEGKLPNDQLPELLFDAWANAPPSLERGRSVGRPITAEEDKECIRSYICEEWDKVAQGEKTLDHEQCKQMLRGCIGFFPSDEVVKECMQRMTSGRGHSCLTSERSREAAPGHVSKRDFIGYCLSFFNDTQGDHNVDIFGNDDDSETSDESGKEEVEDYSPMMTDDLIRRLPGFRDMLSVVIHRKLLMWWRQNPIRMLFFLVIEFAAVFLGIFDRFIFDTPPWMPTGIMNAHISLALLTSVYCLQCFSEDQPVFWRESSHGLNRLSFFVGQTLVDSIDWLLMSFLFTSMYYMFQGPQMTFSAYYLPFVLVGWVASGWGYLVSTTVPPILGPFAAAVISFMLGGILGLPEKMGIFLDAGILEAMVSVACFTRWSVPMDFLGYIEAFPPNKSALDIIDSAQLQLFSRYYRQAHWHVTDGPNSFWPTGIVALLVMGFGIRVLAFLGLCIMNRDKQV